MRRSGLSRPFLAVLLVGYLAFLGWVVLWPSSGPATDVVWRVTDALLHLGVPPDIANMARVEMGLNALMVVPVPFLGALLVPRWTWHRWAAWGFVVSCCVEALQGLFLGDRTAQMADIVANTTGALVGGVLAGLLLRALTGRRVVRG